MKREDIKNAALDFSKRKYGEEYQYPMPKTQACCWGFINGAEWRIKSVWHNLPNDLPEKENTWILLELVFEGRLVYLPVEWVNDGEGAPSQATRWAYIDDLLPERKEESK